MESKARIVENILCYSLWLLKLTIVVFLDCLLCVFTHASVGDIEDFRIQDPGHLSLVFLTRFMKETCSAVPNQYLIHEKLGLCIRNGLNPGCLINENLVLVITEDLFLGPRQIHIKIGITTVCKFLGFRLVVPDRSEWYKTGCLDSFPCSFNFVSF